jgi:DMSO/TMAO reductase YedYZ molybdopterin-dependent catalytic subunit
MKYERSLPLNIALHSDTLLVWAMNGEPLTPHHGYPLRLFVPGWYGMAAVKWLEQIRLITRPFDGYFQTYHYVYWHDDYAPDSEPLQQMQVRALIYTPTPNATIDGPVTIAGTAWTGTGEVVCVEISTEGEYWHEADLEPATTTYSMQCWHYAWSPAQSGRYTIRARATDSHGHTQPLAQRSNQLGYGNNAVHTIQVHMRS